MRFDFHKLARHVMKRPPDKLLYFLENITQHAIPINPGALAVLIRGFANTPRPDVRLLRDKSAQL